MTEQKQERQQSQDSQQGQGQDQQGQGQGRSQSQYDSTFSSLIAGATSSPQSSTAPDSAREAWTAYFDLAEQTLRTARRVSEVQTLSLMRQQIVAEVASQVIQAIQQNPQLVRSSSQNS